MIKSTKYANKLKSNKGYNPWLLDVDISLFKEDLISDVWSLFFVRFLIVNPLVRELVVKIYLLLGWDWERIKPYYL